MTKGLLTDLCKRSLKFAFISLEASRLTTLLYSILYYLLLFLVSTYASTYVNGFKYY